MNRTVQSIVTIVLLTAWVLACDAAPSWASKSRTIRLGYLDHPGSALCRIALDKGYFRKEGLTVKLVRFTDTRRGLAAIDAGTLDAGAFPVAETLNSIAAGTGIRIIAGGGVVLADNPVAELGDHGREDSHSQEIVVSIPLRSLSKHIITHVTAGLLRAYRILQRHPGLMSQYVANSDGVVFFNPNPDYYRLERIWTSLGLQAADMKPDYLANHVYEEIYCDALDRLLDAAADDPVFKELSSKAVCTPDCCPKNKRK